MYLDCRKPFGLCAWVCRITDPTRRVYQVKCLGRKKGRKEGRKDERKVGRKEGKIILKRPRKVVTVKVATDESERQV